jgi:hypothetical protein
MDLPLDILKDINDDIGNIGKYSTNTYLRNILEAAFLPEKKMILPEGVPPYKVSKAPSVQLTGAFWQEAKKLYVYSRAELKPIRREHMFINALESMSKEESEVLLAVKDQTLNKLYPNINRKELTRIGYFNG